MKSPRLLTTVIALTLSSFPNITFGQVPNFGTLSNFVLFTTGGAVGNTGVSIITGDIGANTGAITGFGLPTIVNGTFHNADAITAKGITDLQAAYDQLSATTTTNTTHAPAFGTGETLLAGVYAIGGAASVAGNLILDAQGDPNALFIFKIAGAFTTGAAATITLVNGASPCNIFWIAEGAISMAALTTMKGTLIAHPGAVSMGAGCNLEGRMFSTTGAVSVYGVVAITGCSATTSWTGAAGTSDWFMPGNWNGGVPDETMDALIPANLKAGRVFPIINSGIAGVDTVTIQTAASLTVINSTLQIRGAINNNGTTDAGNGTIEMTGSSGQNLAVNTFANNAVNHLIVSNNSDAGVVLGGALDVYGSLTYSDTTGMKLTTNDYLTLKSNAISTAWIGKITGDMIVGKVTVERYIPAHKAWQFLSIPTNTTQTVQNAWQEGALGINDDPAPGYGTQITSNLSTWSPDGFDLHSTGPSMKSYSSPTNTWIGIPNTNNDNIKGINGYMVFIRGDRTAVAINSPVTQTVLRTRGILYTGDQTPVQVGTDRFTSIGNPYASIIDMRSVAKTGVKDFFYLWDPNLGGASGDGGYQTFSYNGTDYVVTPGFGSYGVAGSVSNYIQSGQAFMIQGNSVGNGSLTFKETAKTSGSMQASVVGGWTQPQVRIGLFGVNADSSVYSIDGALSNYDDSYSNTIDDLDAPKLMNNSENLSIKTAGKLFVIERRQPIFTRDTIFLNLTGTNFQKYRFDFTAIQLNPALSAFLEDNYLHTSTPLDIKGRSVYDFDIVDLPASYAPDRFRIVFKAVSTLAVTFTSVKAFQQNKDIAVEWRSENERNLVQYDVEKSVDGNHYTIVKTVAANNLVLNNYSWLDANWSEAHNFYRIVSIDKNGDKIYSTVVNVFIKKVNPPISIYPNPVTNGIINLQLINQPAGKYRVVLLDQTGQILIATQINHVEGGSIEKIHLNKYTAHGMYKLEVTDPERNVINMNVMYYPD